MKTVVLKVSPTASARRAEELKNQIFLRPGHAGQPKLSWAATARAAVTAAEDWSEWESAAEDGLQELSAWCWPSGRI